MSTKTVTAQCGHKTTDKFATASGGLCPTCLKAAHSVPLVCTQCGTPFLWHKDFAELVGHPERPQQVCPTCADKSARAGDPTQPIIVERQAIQVLPVVIIDIDLGSAQLCDPAGKVMEGRNPARRLIIKDWHGKSYTGRLDVFDFRPDGRRGPGSLARVRVMEATHKEPRTLTVSSGAVMGPKREETLTFEPTYSYLVLEPVAGSELPVARLIAPQYHNKHNASGGVESDQSLWSRHLTSRSRSGMHGGGTLIAIVDDQHPVLVRQDHLVERFGLADPTLEEKGFRTPSAQIQPTIFLAGADADLVEALHAAGVNAKIVANTTFVRPKKLDEGWLLPEGLPTGFEVRLEAAEAGGGMTNTGHSTVAAGLEGETLRPFGTSGHRYHQACGTHAFFGNAGGLVTAAASWWNKSDRPLTVTLTRHTINVEGGVITVIADEIWSGSPDDLPITLGNFSPVVKAAAAKATCYHCACIHYADRSRLGLHAA